MVTLLYFASLRESVGCSREELALPSGNATVSSLVDSLRARDARWTEAFSPGKTWRVAVKDRKSTRLNSSHLPTSRMPSSA